jgi:hypothetical protein
MPCRAGLRAGMHVLGVGCGVGDVSLLSARIVGPLGRGSRNRSRVVFVAGGPTARHRGRRGERALRGSRSGNIRRATEIRRRHRTFRSDVPTGRGRGPAAAAATRRRGRRGPHNRLRGRKPRGRSPRFPSGITFRCACTSFAVFPVVGATQLVRAQVAFSRLLVSCGRLSFRIH